MVFLDDSYGQGLIVLEQCLSALHSDVQTPESDNSRALVFMAMSTLLSERLCLYLIIVRLNYYLNPISVSKAI